MGFESKILASTGFQNRMYADKQELLSLLVENFKSEPKTIEFIQSSLRSASEIYKHGGHVTMKYRDQLFRMHYDNRRVLLWETTIPSTIEALVDSKPLKDVQDGDNLRSISRMYKQKLYGKFSNAGAGVNKYRGNEEIAVRYFLKGVVATPPKFNLPIDSFNTYREIIAFVKDFNPKLRFTENDLSKYKSRHVKVLKVQKSKETEAFVRYVKDKFDSFDIGSFYRGS